MVEAVANVIIDVVLYAVVTIIWFVIAGLLGAIIGVFTGRRIAPPTLPSFASFRSSASSRRSASRFSFLRSNRTNSPTSSSSDSKFTCTHIYWHMYPLSYMCVCYVHGVLVFINILTVSLLFCANYDSCTVVQVLLLRVNHVTML